MTQTQTITQTKLASPTKPNAHGTSKPHSLISQFVPPSSTKRIVTEKELADNNGIGSESGRAWVAIHGQVFDITDFSKQHPGGTMIRLAAGRDATCLVESYHPQGSISKVESALFNKSTYVGALQQVESVTEKTITVTNTVPVYKRPDDAFFLDVRARVDALVGNDRYKYETIGVAEAIVTVLLYFIAVYYVGRHGSWLWAVVLGIMTGRMGFQMHMGNHCAVSRDPWKNRIIGWFMDIAGSNAVIWGYEHQVAHHVEPNEIHRDNDCEIGAPIVRMHPEIPHTTVMKYQHYIIPVAMTVGFFKWYVGDFEHFAKKTVGNVRMAIDREDWKLLLGFKLFWILIHIAFPVYYNGWWIALAQCVLFMGLGGHYLENIFIVNHIQNGLVPPADAHWANKQVMATANWKSGSVFWNFFSGGLNHQIEHHMFPALSQYWYPHIAATVEQCCKEHGITYYDYPDFTTAWVAMWTYLRDMGNVDFVSKTGQKGAAPVGKSGKVHAA